MGERGPVGKRSDERVRRNKEGGDAEKLTAIGKVEQPPLGIPDAHPIVEDFYESLSESAEAQYFEPSDWQYARFICVYMSDQLQSGKLSGQMLASITSALADLMVAEGHRRRLRLEVEREQSKADVVDMASKFREMNSKAQ